MALKSVGKLVLKIQITNSKGITTDSVYEGPEIICGRGSQCQLSINDIGISRQHLKIEIKNQQVYLTDLKSANGTFVNDEKIEPDVPVMYDTFFMPVRLGPKVQLLLIPENKI